MQILILLYAVVCIFGAAVVRGYSGFGFSLLAVTSLSLLLPPTEIVPSIFIMEVAASLHLLPGVWRDIQWRALLWLAVGSLLGTPFGVYALAHVPAAPMTLALAVFVLIAAILLAQGYALKSLPGPAVTFATGTASGLFNGSFGTGGPPVILFFFSSPAGAAVGRASMIAFFLMTDVIGLAWQGWSGLLSATTLWRALLFLPALTAGIWLGNRGFMKADPADFRRWVLRLLMLLAVLAGARALTQILMTPSTPAALADAKQIAIVGVTVVNPEREAKDAAVADATVVISGDRIVAVGSRASTPLPPGAMQIDGRGKWVIPGMIDGHVHFFQSGNLYTRPDVADFNAVMPYAREVARNKARLAATFKVWLASGVTGVIDVGGPFWNFDVRAAAERSAAAPRVATTGPLISMVARPQLELDDPPIIKVDSPAAARDLVRRELERKPDFIKVWFIHRPGDDMAAQEAIVKATADAAHAAHVRLAVHATELDTAKAALRAGADYLVHSVSDAPVDEEFIRLARANHALLCPTLFVVSGYQYALSNRWRASPEEQRLADPQILATMHDLDRMRKDLIPERVAKSMADAAPPPAPTVALENLKVLWDRGIPIVMGTDAGNIGTLHGPSVFREMALMRDAGLTPLQILRSATTNGARAMGRSDLGAIAPGKLADVVLLDADPLADVANLSHAERVIKAGVVYDPKTLIDSIR